MGRSIVMGALQRRCPCGACSTLVDDQNGYLTSVTAWVIAVDRLCQKVSEAMTGEGGVSLAVSELTADTRALRDLVVRTCHEGGTARAIWTIRGLVTVWEQTLALVEPQIAATFEPDAYLAWHAETADIRAQRHGD